MADKQTQKYFHNLNNMTFKPIGDGDHEISERWAMLKVKNWASDFKIVNLSDYVGKTEFKYPITLEGDSGQSFVIETEADFIAFLLESENETNKKSIKPKIAKEPIAPVPSANKESETHLEDLKKIDLQEIAKNKNIPFQHATKKAELIRLIIESESKSEEE